MTYQEPLSRRVIAVSVSESPDMAVLGLGREHLDDAMAEMARHLLAMGARLLYGGDLRPQGFSELLFELVARYRRDADVGDERVGVTNVLAYPVHVSLSASAVKEISEGLRGTAELVCLASDGHMMTEVERQALPVRTPTEGEWQDGLTTMRRWMAEKSDARIVLGGRVEGFKGRMPGVAEEALLALRRGQPLYMLGGFGGCARDLADCLGLGSNGDAALPFWPAANEFSEFAVESLQNGLSSEENATLARTVHIDQAMALILRGLLRRFPASTS